MNAHLQVFELVERSQVPAADFHMHTTWTDGEATVAAMHSRAVEVGLEVVLFSEHARRSSGEWFEEFASEVRALPSESCLALVGVESKIDDFDGTLDAREGILELCDLVMASVHRFPGEVVFEVGDAAGYSKQQAIDLEFRLARAALNNPRVDILGHPFGMCYRRFGFAPPEDKMRELIEEAAGTGVAVEVNCHYHPDPWRLIDWCEAAGAPISLGSNAHSLETVGRIRRTLMGSEQPWTPSELR